MQKRLFMTNDVAKTALLPLEIALYRACKDQHGSMSAIAEINGFDRDRFINQCDPTKTGYQQTPETMIAIIKHTRDPRPVDAVIEAYGNAGWFEIPHPEQLGQGDFYRAIGQCGIEMGEMSKVVCELVSDDKVCKLDAAKIKKECMDVIRAAAQIMAMADAAKDGE